MCRATTDPGGPRRCSGDTRTALARSSHALAVLEETDRILNRVAADLAAEQPTPRRVSFADKETRSEDIRQEIDAAMDNLGNSEAWKQWLDFAGRFHNYSLMNQLLIQMQCPEATHVSGFKAWKAMGRNITPGSKAIWVRAPRFARKGKKKDPADDTEGGNRPSADPDEDRATPVGYFYVPVFDISQTEGTPPPARPEVVYTRTTGTAPPEMHTELEKQVRAHGYTVERQALPDSGAEGFTDSAGKKVVISTRYSDAHQAMVLAHELAHIEMGHTERHHEYHSRAGGQRPTMEVEAESAAYIIGRRYGLTPGGSSFAYINGWAHGDSKKVQETAKRVTKAADKILGRITDTTTPAAT